MWYFPLRKLHLVVIVVPFLIQSCVTNKKTTLLQEYKESEYTTEYTPPETYLIQTNDNLYIRVATPDPRLSEIFNVMPVGGIMGNAGESTHLLSYPVQLDGTIELPYLGTIPVEGKTLTEAKQAIEIELAQFVSDASISVKIVNNYVTVLGEVNTPGMYPIYKDRLNIFQALAMAGDLGEYSNRYTVNVIRQSGEGSVIKEIDVTDKNIVDSEFYYVMPNDVIYVNPMKGKFFRMNQFPLTLMLTTITTALSIFILIQNSILIQD